MSVSYRFHLKSKLAALCVLEGANQFVRIEGKAWLSVEDILQHDPKLFRRINDDIDRGYRATEDPVLVRIEDTFLRYANATWEMSYLGKAVLRANVTSESRLVHLKQEVEGLIELMESKVEFYTTFDGYIVCKAPVSRKQKETKRGRKRLMPVIDHQFQQIRPLIQKVLEEQKPDRIEIRRLWAARPVIPLDWRD